MYFEPKIKEKQHYFFLVENFVPNLGMLLNEKDINLDL